MNTKIAGVVTGVLIIAGGTYYYTNTDMDDTSEFTTSDNSTFIKSDSTVDNSNNPSDIDSSVSNVNMTTMDAEISSDIRAMNSGR